MTESTQMSFEEKLRRLSEHRRLGAAPREELEWLAQRARYCVSDPGDVIVAEGESPPNLWVLLSGHVAFYGGRGATRGKLMDWHAGDVAGVLPYSRLTHAPGDAIAEEPVEMLQVHSDHFPEMIRAAPQITTILVHAMLDRARQFTKEYLQDAKMASLGKLSAGLAHELNNPASAAARSAKLLRQAISDACVAARALGETGLNPEQAGTLEQLQASSLGDKTRLWSALDFSDREERFEEWLDERDLESEMASQLAETALAIEDLDELGEALAPEQMAAALRWIAAEHAATTLTRELESTASRIHQLVSAIKRFSYMDRAATVEAVNIAQGIEDTITMLASKMRAKKVRVTVELPAEVPLVRATGGELNQVWQNLLDNALDAVPEGGIVEVSACRRRDQVVVEVADNGPGIDEKMRDRIFDPFFTTKPVGQGTGLGLDIARRIATRHNGDIELESRPGRTIFRVVLPAAGEAQPAAGLAAGTA